MAEVLPLLYLHGLSSRDFVPALEEFFGSGAGLSASAITRLTEAWQEEYRRFAGRDLSGADFVYLWADGIHFGVRLDNDRVGGLVLNTRDVTERHALEEELRRQAFSDSLTGLANRALLLDRVGHALARFARGAAPMANRGPQAMPIRSAGAVVWRPGPDGGSVLLIHRERYNDWTFPKWC